MLPPQLAVIRTESLPEMVINDFRKIVASEGLDLRIETREETGPVAAIEWLLTSALFVYIGKSYFDGFLKEMGKDHYVLLKAGLKTFYSKFFGAEAPKVTVYGTSGKSTKDLSYSTLFSIIADANGAINFKLLFQRQLTEIEYEEIINSFLEFLEIYHANKLDHTSMEQMRQTRMVGKTLLLAFDHKTKRIIPIDPIPKKSEKSGITTGSS